MTKEEALVIKARMKNLADYLNKYFNAAEPFVAASEPSKDMIVRLEVAATAAGLAYCQIAEALGPHGSGHI